MHVWKITKIKTVVCCSSLSSLNSYTRSYIKFLLLKSTNGNVRNVIYKFKGDLPQPVLSIPLYFTFPKIRTQYIAKIRTWIKLFFNKKNLPCIIITNTKPSTKKKLLNFLWCLIIQLYYTIIQLLAIIFASVNK